MKLSNLTRFFCVLGLLVLGMVDACAQEPAFRDAFTRGNDAYSSGKYTEALDAYREALKQLQSAGVHQNIASAYQKAGDVGRAVLHYERALALEPANADARANLVAVRKAAGLPEEKIGVLERLAYMMPADGWAWCAAVAFWGVLAPVVLARAWKLRGAWPTCLAAFCALALAVCVLGLLGWHMAGARGIILKDTALKVSPTENSPAVAPLAAGESASIQEHHEAYFLVRLPNGREGWLEARVFEPVWSR